jgi:hypothetical protein
MNAEVKGGYEAPSVEQVDAEDSPAVTAAGQTDTPV